MRIAKKYMLLVLLGIFFITSCKKYLEKTPEANLSEKDVFTNYDAFQGFLDENYYNLRYWMSYGAQERPSNWAGECAQVGSAWVTGDYWTITASNDMVLGTGNGRYAEGMTYWQGGWQGIRKCNIGLRNFHLLSEATEEQKQLIKGQIYFFRAYLHDRIINNWGGMPYVDTVFASTDVAKLPRLTYQETAERIDQDYDRAIQLLPDDWDYTALGAQSPGANLGRVTKGAAMAFKARNLLFAGSPLMNKSSGKDISYNKAYCERAAAAAWELIKLAKNTGLYTLMPWENYTDNFYRMDGTFPWCKETIWGKVQNSAGSTFASSQYVKYDNTWNSAKPTQNFVDRFEMADGTLYKTEYDNNNAKRWDYRDPRFRNAVMCDRDLWGYNVNATAKFYTGAGSVRASSTLFLTPYRIKKFWAKGVNQYDNMFTPFRMSNPFMRFAEVYLIYAEAVTAAYRPDGRVPGADLTAVDAINLIRARAKMPPVTSTATGYDSFMDLIYNERHVELCFEGQMFDDVRRWYRANDQKYKYRENVDLIFDKDWTSFNRQIISTTVFLNPMHYWLPIPRTDTQLYFDMPQNPGWN